MTAFGSEVFLQYVVMSKIATEVKQLALAISVKSYCFIPTEYSS